jgi:2-polyprenyl-3-methyl-5-hydroxy-6-metoxy-1,4-benzoquinol methylase
MLLLRPRKAADAGGYRGRMVENDVGERAHWERVYAQVDPREVSWYEPAPEISLALIAQAGPALDAAILDVGGGASGLAAALLRDGYSDVTVADIAETSIGRAETQLAGDAERVRWVQADVRSHDFGRRYDLWHDRAVLHFMVNPADRDGYLEVLDRTLRPGGHAIFATFGPDGPTSCSGLPIHRYAAAELARLLGSEYHTLASRLHEHKTPSGATQQFLYLLARRSAQP